jgi:hypothetical protein
MKIHANILLSFCVLLIAVAACAPQVEVEGPRTSVYDGTPEQVFSTLLQAVSSVPPPEVGQGILAERPDPDGWQITQSDRAGGFLQVQLNVSRTVGAGYFDDVDRVTFVVSPTGDQQTSVVFQSVATDPANSLLNYVRTSLKEDFGEPIL